VKPGEWERKYHSLERVMFVNTLPCIACGLEESQNAHTRTGGMGRKSDYTTIVPLCDDHHREHHAGAKSFAARYKLDLAREALVTEAKWLAFSATGDGRSGPQA
jgi:hypothetical protein